MANVFGWPDFDENGEKILTTYENEYKDMNMDIRVYQMRAEEVREFSFEDEEMAVLLLQGKVIFRWDENLREVSRKDVFSQGPWCLHVCAGQKIMVTAVENAEILVQRTYNDRRFAAKLYDPEDAPWKYSCKGKFGNVANRRVNTIFDHDIAPFSNMVLCEVLNVRGKLYGYLPH